MHLKDSLRSELRNAVCTYIKKATAETEAMKSEMKQAAAHRQLIVWALTILV
jgi:hypothetical protein